MSQVVGEGEVLVATVKYLFRNGSIPTQISVPRGRGIDTKSIQENVKRVFRDESLGSDKLEFLGTGPDIVAVSDDLYWKVECKGSGTGKPATQRNNFDRALASVVSYYEDSPKETAETVKNARVVLGLALPATDQYLRLLKARVGKPLRARLNLWVLLHYPKRREVEAITPNEAF